MDRFKARMSTNYWSGLIAHWMKLEYTSFSPHIESSVTQSWIYASLNLCPLSIAKYPSRTKPRLHMQAERIGSVHTRSFLDDKWINIGNFLQSFFARHACNIQVRWQDWCFCVRECGDLLMMILVMLIQTSGYIMCGLHDRPYIFRRDFIIRKNVDKHTSPLPSHASTEY